MRRVSICRVLAPDVETGCDCPPGFCHNSGSRIERRATWLDYLAERTGTFHYRVRRYSAVARELERLGLTDGDLIYDVGAGMCEFAKYLYGMGWTGRYVPIDGSIDGTNLDWWVPTISADFVVAIETVEHLVDPQRFFTLAMQFSTKGAVVTTPNAEVVDVKALDRTHVHALSRFSFPLSWKVRTEQFFNRDDDSLLASWGNHA